MNVERANAVIRVILNALKDAANMERTQGLTRLDLEWVRIGNKDNKLSFSILPNEELKRIVFYRQPDNVYNQIPEAIREFITRNNEIPLSPSNCFVIDGELYFLEGKVDFNRA